MLRVFVEEALRHWRRSRSSLGMIAVWAQLIPQL